MIKEPADETQHRHARRYECRSVHQVAEHDAVPDPGDESGTPQEGPVVAVGEGVALNGEGRGPDATRAANASATFRTEMMLMMPIAAKTDSMIRAVTYPSETVSLCRLTSG